MLQAREIPSAEPANQLDVATIVQHFIALRQEVNLQTKSSRAQLEQNAQTLSALQQALEAVRQPAEDSEKAAEDAARPLLKTLIDAHDALSLGRREVQRLLDNAPATQAPVPVEKPPEIKLRIPTWARWFGLDASVEAQLAPLRAWSERSRCTPSVDDAAERYRQSLDALLVGYAMGLQRLERAFEQHGLEAIPCVGEPFDPETMEVAEVVREEGRDSTEVVQEIRRGYLWHGKLFRYAQVRVAKP